MTLTIEALARLAADLDPRAAISAKGIDRSLCVTPLITELVHHGAVVPLSGEPGAAYVRVSTDQQRDDGFSLDEQIYRAIQFFLERGQPFCLYSDATLSGFYPPDDATMINAMVEKHAARYRRNFEAIFLSPHSTRKYTAAQMASMRQHMEESMAEIKRAKSVVYQTDDIRVQSIGKLHYRPGLTLLFKELSRYTVLAVSDLSRLYRNEAIAAEFGQRLEETGYKCKVVGLIESLEYLNDAAADAGAAMQRWFFSFLAERQLSSITLNTLRGTLQMLESGRPHAKLPYFYARDTDGRAVFLPGMREALTRLIELVTTPGEEGRRRSYIEISIAMQQEGSPQTRHRENWSRRRLTDILGNPCLYGVQKHFGLEFSVYPPLIDKAQWDRLQLILADTKMLNPHHRSAVLKRTMLKSADGALTETCYLATGLLRCVCGSRMCHNVQPRFNGYICTAQISTKIKTAVEGAAVVRHSRFIAEDLHGFLHAFIRSYRAVARQFSDEDDARFADLKAQLSRYQDRLLECRLALQQQITARTPELAEQFRIDGYEEGDIPAAVRAKLNAATRQARREIETLERMRDGLDAELARYLAQADAVKLNERMEQWDHLDVREQNAILLTIFDRWEVRGSDPQCTLAPVYRTGKELPAIPLVTTVQTAKASGRQKYTRRFPTVDQYIAQVFAARLGRNTAETE